MADTCAYRAAGNDAAAKAAYEEWHNQYFGRSNPHRSEWEGRPESVKNAWRAIFQAGHKAYRDVIKEENESKEHD